MKTVYAKHLPYDDGHLGKVAAAMDHHGSPTIRVVEFDGELYAIEGSHRLAVAKERNITPKLVAEIPEDDALPSSHWKRVAGTLPAYNFEHILLLKLSDFVK